MNSVQIIDLAEITSKEKIGHGSYGIVYKAEWAGLIVAVKEFAASSDQKTFENEINQLSRVQHPNIIALFGISNDLQSKFIIMEHAEGGSLHTFLHGAAKPYYSTAHAMSWARQCAEGVAYLHAMKPKPMIHRDLKPLNLLLSNKARILKICDFGTVVDIKTQMTNFKGTVAYMAPEVFEGSRYTEKCDIFSWAIVLWEVLAREQPFKDSDNACQILWGKSEGHRPPLIEDCPETIEKLMTSSWDRLPDKRPSMQHIVAVMNELVASFPGAEEPIEYEFDDQDIILPDSYACNTSTSNSMQSIPTNYTDAIPPEEQATSFYHTPTDHNNNVFHRTPTAEVAAMNELVASCSGAEEDAMEYEFVELHEEATDYEFVDQQEHIIFPDSHATNTSNSNSTQSILCYMFGVDFFTRLFAIFYNKFYKYREHF